MEIELVLVNTLLRKMRFEQPINYSEKSVMLYTYTFKQSFTLSTSITFHQKSYGFKVLYRVYHILFPYKLPLTS